MATFSFDRSWLPALCLAACVGCAYSNVKTDGDRHPVVNTGVGATILYPGQGPAMPAAHPAYQLPGGAPAPGQPGARGPHGQPLPAPAGSRTIGGTPSSNVQQGPGSSAGSSGGGGITFIGGTDMDMDGHRESRQEPRWLKYLLAPFALAAYPFVAIHNAVTGDDGPPPGALVLRPRHPAGADLHAAGDHDPFALCVVPERSLSWPRPGLHLAFRRSEPNGGPPSGR